MLPTNSVDDSRPDDISDYGSTPYDVGTISTQARAEALTSGGERFHV